LCNLNLKPVQGIDVMSLFHLCPQRPTTDIPDFRMTNCEAWYGQWHVNKLKS